MNDTILLSKGMKTLIDTFGIANAERFIYLVNKNPLDYTKFRHTLFEGMTLETIIQEAAEARKQADQITQNNPR